MAGIGIGLGYNAMKCLAKINPDLEQRIKAVGVPSTVSFNTKNKETLFSMTSYKGKYTEYGNNLSNSNSNSSNAKTRSKSIPTYVKR